MDWQPIATAPKDGTEVIGYMKPMKVEVVWYFAPSKLTFGWLNASSKERKPTHWMPLPAPPAPTQETPNE